MHEAGHAVVALAVGLKVREVRIMDGVPKEAVGYMNGGATVTYSDEILGTRETHLARIATKFGGMAAERIVIGDHSDGAGGSEDSDLRTATELASLVEGAYAMGEHLVSWASENPGDMTIAWLRSRNMEQRVEALLQEQMRRAEDAVRANQHAVELLAARLVAGLRVDGAEVVQIFEGSSPAASAAPRDRERPSVSEAGKHAGRRQ